MSQKLSEKIQGEYPKGATMESWVRQAQELEAQVDAFTGAPRGAPAYRLSLSSQVFFTPNNHTLGCLEGNPYYTKLKASVQAAIQHSPPKAVSCSLWQLLSIFGPFIEEVGIYPIGSTIQIQGSNLIALDSIVGQSTTINRA